MISCNFKSFRAFFLYFLHAFSCTFRHLEAHMHIHCRNKVFRVELQIMKDFMKCLKQNEQEETKNDGDKNKKWVEEISRPSSGLETSIARFSEDEKNTPDIPQDGTTAWWHCYILPRSPSPKTPGSVSLLTVHSKYTLNLFSKDFLVLTLKSFAFCRFLRLFVWSLLHLCNLSCFSFRLHFYS